MIPSKRLFAPVLFAGLALALMSMAPSVLAKPGAAKVRSFHGTVSSVARDHRSFRIRRAGKASVRIRLVRSTKKAKGVRVKRGQALAVRARRTPKGLVATRIASLRTRGDDDAGSDDPSLHDPTLEDESTEADDDAPGSDENPPPDAPLGD
jgi:hypothetical protein